MRQNRRRTDSRRSADDKIKYMCMAVIPPVIVLVLVVIMLATDRKPSNKEASASTDVSLSTDEGINMSGDSSVSPEDGGVEPGNNQYTTDFSQYELKKDEIPQVNQLISEYFQAEVDQDARTLYRIFGKSDDTGLDARKEELKNEAVYIEDYADIVCYTKPGLTADSYAAYVTYEVKFRRVETLAPGLMWCYAVRDDNGNFIIRENVVDDEADYVAKQSRSGDVKPLSNQVNERLRQVIESDTVLAGVYKDLRNGAVVRSPEEETGTGGNTVVLGEEGGSGTVDGPSAKIEQAWRVRLTMDVKDFDYELSEELAAWDPLEDRSASRLMALDRETGEMQHRIFKDITQYLWPGDCLVINDTKVIPVRLFGVKKDTGAKMEILLLKRGESDIRGILVRSGKKARPGIVIGFGEDLLTGTAVDTVDDGNRMIQFYYKGTFEGILGQLSQMSLPPYITHQLRGKNRYQTVCVRHEDSAAAPTVGLHFTQELLVEIGSVGVKVVYVTLYVGLGTFRPVKMENVQDHHMHSEFYIVEESEAKKVNNTRAAGGRVTCMGTTSCRTAESASIEGSVLKSGIGQTEIFICPGYRFKVLDAPITNFRLPQPTLVMPVSALTGREHILNAYREAVKERYRFFSFGDAMFIVVHPIAEKRQGLWE